MSGALLRSGNLREFQALGAVGNPVYSAASQLRAAMRRQFGPQVADLFAVPKQNEHGDAIDWYAPVAGDVIPWSVASPEERAQAKAALLQAREQLAARSRSLQSEDDRERQIFGKLLEQATRIPSDEHVYLVDGRPVMTFWGFSEQGARPGLDVLGELDTGTPTPTPAVAPAPPAEVPERGRPWYWWLWLIPLLLLLLALLWLGLRACSPAVEEETLGPAPIGELTEPAQAPGPVTETLEPLPPEPERLMDRPVEIVRERSDVVVGTVPGTVVSGTSGVDTTVVDDTTTELGTDLEGQSEAIAPPDTPADAATEALEPPPGPTDVPPEALAPPVEPTDVPPEPAEPPVDPNEAAPETPEQPAEAPAPADGTEPPAPEAAAPETQPPPFPEAPTTAPTGIPEGPGASQGTPLTIPPEAVQSGSTAFLQGEWRSLTGLQDSQGNPVQLRYDFQDGAGTATLLRGSGASEQRCSGAVRPVMRDGKLVIEETGSITCPDGTVFRRSNVECTVGEGNRAECRGVNADGTSYNVDISGK